MQKINLYYSQHVTIELINLQLSRGGKRQRYASECINCISLNKCKECIIYLKFYIENSVDPDELASDDQDPHCFSST